MGRLDPEPGAGTQGRVTIHEQQTGHRGPAGGPGRPAGESPAPCRAPAPPAGSRRVVLPDARPGPRGRARRLLDRPWNGTARPPAGSLKRLMDIAVSAMLLLLFSPLFAVVALAIL